MEIHKENIVCCACSSAIGLVVTCSIDGMCILSRTPDLLPLKQMSVLGIPRNVFFTLINHFIVFLLEKNGVFTILITTPNFETLSTTTINGRIKQIIPATFNFCDVIIVQERKESLMNDEVHVYDCLTMEEPIEQINLPSNKNGLILGCANSEFPLTLTFYDGRSLYSTKATNK